MVLRTLVGLTRYGLRLASTYAPLVSPLPWIPFGARRAYRNPRSALTPTYPSLVATSCFALRFIARASHRNLLALAIDSLGDHPPSMVLLYHTRSNLSRVLLGFFCWDPEPTSGYKRIARLVLRHHGVPLLGYDPCPSEGLGFASPPDMIMILHNQKNVNRFFEKSFFIFL